MNRVLVAYASKMGSTREIAEKIGSRLDRGRIRRAGAILR